MFLRLSSHLNRTPRESEVTKSWLRVLFPTSKVILRMNRDNTEYLACACADVQATKLTVPWQQVLLQVPVHRQWPEEAGRRSLRYRECSYHVR